MPCGVVKFPGGHAIVCGLPKQKPRKCSVCKRQTANPKLCDFQVGKGKTCDAVMCTSCADHREPDTDYCPLHSAAVNGKLRL